MSAGENKAVYLSLKALVGYHVTVSRSTASMSDFSPLAQHDLSKTLHKRILMTNTQFDIYQSQLAVEYLRGT